MSRGTTGAVELYHALRFLQSGEPLRAPLGVVVGGLVTDFDSHGSFVVESILQGQGRSGCQAVAVHPCPFAGFARIPEHTQDGTTRHPSVAVFSQRGVKPADPCSSRDRVKAQGPDALGVVTVDGVAHRSFVVVCIVAGRRAQWRSEMINESNPRVDPVTFRPKNFITTFVNKINIPFLFQLLQVMANGRGNGVVVGIMIGQRTFCNLIDLLKSKDLYTRHVHGQDAQKAGAEVHGGCLLL